MDFGPAASDYSTHRKGFPASFFERFPLVGDVLDLGTGTGTLARGYALRGAKVVALDRSLEMLRHAPGNFMRVAAKAEACPIRDASFDAVIAGQCWHWFEGLLTARECWRLLRSGGRVAIAHFDYLAQDGNVAEETERLILRHNPVWTMAGSDGKYERWRPHLQGAGFEELESFWYDESVEYSQEAWRGRIRACNGVMALAEPARRQQFDAALAELLATRYPEVLIIPHRVFVITGRRLPS